MRNSIISKACFWLAAIAASFALSACTNSGKHVNIEGDEEAAMQESEFLYEFDYYAEAGFEWDLEEKPCPYEVPDYCKQETTCIRTGKLPLYYDLNAEEQCVYYSNCAAAAFYKYGTVEEGDRVKKQTYDICIDNYNTLGGVYNYTKWGSCEAMFTAIDNNCYEVQTSTLPECKTFDTTAQLNYFRSTCPNTFNVLDKLFKTCIPESKSLVLNIKNCDSIDKCPCLEKRLINNDAWEDAWFETAVCIDNFFDPASEDYKNNLGTEWKEAWDALRGCIQSRNDYYCGSVTGDIKNLNLPNYQCVLNMIFTINDKLINGDTSFALDTDFVNLVKGVCNGTSCVIK